MCPATETARSDASPALNVAMQRDVRPWLDLIDQLRAFNIEQDIGIPQIAVMGDQSSGKSSVLEAISGISFPRGSGLVTRCATQLTMKRAKPGEPWSGNSSVTWDKAQPAAAGPIESKEEVGAVIGALTEALTTDSEFSSDSIVIEITAPDVPDLTLIDLPGIVRTTTFGQSKGVIQEVERLLNKYLEQERTVVLAVVPANQDIATVDILERAQRVDPDGDRTIGVLTKADLIGPGGEEEVLAVLQNVRKPLKLGYVAVKNRSQQQLNADVTLEDAVEGETAFFATHSHFADIKDRSLFGVNNLTDKLTQILVSRIQVSLPEMTKEVDRLLKECTSQLEKLGRPPPETTAEQSQALVLLFQEYEAALTAAVRARYSSAPTIADDKQFFLYARAHQRFEQLQTAIQDSKPDFKGKDFQAQLMASLRSHHGRQLPGVMNQEVFNLVMHRVVQLWVPATEECRTNIYNDTLEVCVGVLGKMAGQYPALASTCTQKVRQNLELCVARAKERMDVALSAEQTDPFTLNHYLYDTYRKERHDAEGRHTLEVVRKAIASVQRDHPQQYCSDSHITSRHVVPMDYDDLEELLLEAAKDHLNEQSALIGNASNEAQEAEDMSALLAAYWKVSAKRFIDLVPKLLDEEILKPLPKMIQADLFALVSSPQAMGGFFAEDAKVRTLRMELEAKKDRLQKAQRKLHENPWRS